METLVTCSHTLIELPPSPIYEGVTASFTLHSKCKMPLRFRLDYITHDENKVTFFPCRGKLMPMASIDIFLEVININIGLNEGRIKVTLVVESKEERNSSSRFGGTSSSSSFSSSQREGQRVGGKGEYHLPLRITALPLLPLTMIATSSEITDEVLIGSGAAAGVYRSSYQGKQVAVKKYRVTELTKDDIDEWTKEVKILSKVNHPLVVKLLAVCTEFPDLMIIMEYLQHGSLKTVLASTNPLSLSLRLRYAIDGARAMAYLHSLDILHRDVKSDNFLVTSLNENDQIVIKVSDFSLGKIMTKERNRFLSQTNIGTAQYKSPEILQNKPCTKESDVWAFGVVLWELVTRKTPYPEFKWPVEIENYVKNGGRLVLDEDDLLLVGREHFPDSYRDLVDECFLAPDHRPNFLAVTQTLYSMQTTNQWKVVKPDPGKRKSVSGSIQI